ncbi:MAG: YegP family protein [Bacteroidales bacterium]|nr:YegP family protein [Lentimicrobiaceae bacterium]MDD5695382.1 YegP family protein [Bacteroidales bacterium]
MAKFEVYQSGAKNEYRFRLIASNGQTILSSEGYNAKAGCMNGIESVRKNAMNPKAFEKSVTTNGQFRFNLKAPNGQIIGTSQNYKSEDGRNNGILSVMKNAPEANIVE